MRVSREKRRESPFEKKTISLQSMLLPGHLISSGTARLFNPSKKSSLLIGEASVALVFFIFLPAADAVVLTSPKTDPVCLGAMSSMLTTTPFLWKPFEKMARDTRVSAAGYDLVWPENRGRRGKGR